MLNFGEYFDLEPQGMVQKMAMSHIFFSLYSFSLDEIIIALALNIIH